MTHYDIFLPQGLNSNLDLHAIIQTILEEHNFHLRTDGDLHLEGFIGLKISDILAKNIWEQLKSHDVKSVIAPSRYGQAPLLTIGEAQYYAQSAVEQMKAQDPADKLGELFYIREDVLWYTFSIFSKKLAEEKRSPSSYSINIDKIDGHLWKDVHEAMNVTLDTWFY
jgi:hypothetical protein